MPSAFNMQVEKDCYKAASGSHAIAVLTEWDVYKTLDFRQLYDSMVGSMHAGKQGAVFVDITPRTSMSGLLWILQPAGPARCLPGSVTTTELLDFATQVMQ